jgi:uncharacterized protein YdaL
MVKYKGLEAYSKYKKKQYAVEFLLQFIHDNCLDELNSKGKKAVIGNVEFHITKKSTKIVYSSKAQDEIDKLKARISRIKKTEVAAGRFKRVGRNTFDACIPNFIKRRIEQEMRSTFAKSILRQP